MILKGMLTRERNMAGLASPAPVATPAIPPVAAPAENAADAAVLTTCTV